MVWVVIYADPVSGVMRSLALPLRYQSGESGLGCDLCSSCFRCNEIPCPSFKVPEWGEWYGL